MYATVEEFLKEWENESASTFKVLDKLTDETVHKDLAPNVRTLGRAAWHIVTCIHEMMSRTGLDFPAPGDENTVPATASAIAEAYRSTSKALAEAIRTQWTDANLTETKDMYGDMWENRTTLNVLIKHEIHHRGQLTILMRLAGLKVPDIYGPAYEGWGAYGMEPPAV